MYLPFFRFVLRSPTIRHMLAAGALIIFAFYSLSQWLPTFFRRSHGMSGTEVGIAIGLLIGVGGGLGTFLGGWLSDMFSRRDIRWSLWLSAIIFAFAFPFYFVAIMIADKWSALAALFIPAMASLFATGPLVALLQGLVKLRMRAMVVAIFSSGDQLGRRRARATCDRPHQRFAECPPWERITALRAAADSVPHALGGTASGIGSPDSARRPGAGSCRLRD